MSTSMKSTEDNHEKVISITAMTPEEVVANWEHENIINSGAVEKLFEEGFTSLEALRLLDEEDLSKVKIPRDQKKLIRSCVRILNGSNTAEKNLAQPPVEEDGLPQTSRQGEVCPPLPDSVPYLTDQSGTMEAPSDNNNDGQNDGPIHKIVTFRDFLIR